MQLLLAPQVVKRLKRELHRAGRREIGGLLLGEHVRDELFRVVEISVQRSGGSQACFMRQPKDHEKQLRRFFAKTGGDYTRFNYMGEWHSHPSFEPMPSDTDLLTMQSIVNDPSVGAHFLVLLITKLGKNAQVEVSAVAFRAGAVPINVIVVAEPAPQHSSESSFSRWLSRIFGK